jgi:microcystin-dependent protein
MSTTLQTKKIPLLPETTTGSTNDLLVLERVSTGITSRITSANLFTSALGATNYSVPNPSAGGHIVNLQYLDTVKTQIMQTIYNIGALYFTTAAGNPSVLLGFGTWVAFGAGRTIVGIDGSQSEFNSIEETGGSKTHTLTTAELPAHSHVVNPPATNTTSNGDHSHTWWLTAVGNQGYFSSGNATGASTSTSGQNGYTVTTSTNGAHTHTVDIPSFNSDNAGSGNAHNNLQPYIVVYMWKRTA